jgi:type III secretory pathway component EscS
MQELWLLIKLSAWAFILACLLAIVVSEVQKYFISVDKQDFDSSFDFESGE